MNSITKKELEETIENHWLWLQSKKHGKRLILSRYDLSGADLRRCNLSGADLRGADLRGCDLSGCDLRGCDLSEVKKDVYNILEKAINEITGLYDALQRGHIDGSAYQGECACLVGTIAKCRKEHYRRLTIKLVPDEFRPAERWFLAIRSGDIPATNQVSKITAEWIEEFAKIKGIALPKYKIVSSVESPQCFESRNKKGNE